MCNVRCARAVFAPAPDAFPPRCAAGDVDTTVAVSISNTFAYAGYEFATVDNADPFTVDLSGCQEGPVQLPSGGWEVAADDTETLTALLGPRTQFGA